MANHWVGHSLMKPINVDEFFNGRVIIHEFEYSLNEDATIETSVVAEEETQSAVVTEAVQKDADLNTKRNKRGKISSTNQDADNLEEQENN